MSDDLNPQARERADESMVRPLAPADAYAVRHVPVVAGRVPRDG
jgi:hypothetical protein